MPTNQLALKPQLPDFGLSEQYKADKWVITEWDYYKNSNESSQRMWDWRSRAYDLKFDFTLCNNLYIREECKYFIFYLMEYKHVSVATIGEYFDRFKSLSEYINIYMVNSTTILDLVDLSLYEFFLSTKRRVKTVLNDGTALIGTEYVKLTRKSRFVTFIEYCQRVIREYYESDMKETDKLVWDSKNLVCKVSNENNRILDFREFDNPAILKPVQAFCKHELDKITINNIGEYLLSLRKFYLWIKDNSTIKNFKDLDRDTIEKYMLWLRSQTDYTSHKMNLMILQLKVFLEWGVLMQRKDMPNIVLIIEGDYTFKKETSPKYISNEEMKKVMEMIPLLPKTEAKIVFCLIYLGVRYSELQNLSPDSIRQDDDGNYYLNIEQYKTIHEYGKPIPSHIALLMKKEVAKNRRKFGEENVKYIFVNDSNMPISRNKLNKVIRQTIVDNDIRGEDGKFLHVTTHYFRAFCATKLVQGGTDPKAVAQLLGQNTLSALSSYLTVTKKETKEYLKPRLDKIDFLIQNMGKISELSPDDFPKRPLCNGFCGKNPLTEPCAKANACLNCSMFIPSIQHLNKYYFELQDVKAAIATYEKDGYLMLIRKLKQEEQTLENIIAKLEAKRKELKNG